MSPLCVGCGHARPAGGETRERSRFRLGDSRRIVESGLAANPQPLPQRRPSPPAVTFEPFLPPRSFDFSADLPPGHALALSDPACDSAVVLDLLGPPAGEVVHEHRLICLQRWLSPLTVRPLRAAGGWQVLRPQTRLWRPEEPQYYQWEGSVHQQFVLLTRERVERILERPYAACGIDRWGGQDFDDRLVTQLITAMTQDCADASPAGPLVVDALVTALVARLAGSTPPSMARHRLGPARVRRVLEFIDSELHRPIGLDELAAQADVGVRRFCAAFRDAVGTSPHQHVLQRRVERAKALLCSGSAGLAEIAVAVGFSDQSQFTRTFSRIAGVSPGRYRARHSGRR